MRYLITLGILLAIGAIFSTSTSCDEGLCADYCYNSCERAWRCFDLTTDQFNQCLDDCREELHEYTHKCGYDPSVVQNRCDAATSHVGSMSCEEYKEFVNLSHDKCL